MPSVQMISNSWSTNICLIPQKFIGKTLLNFMNPVKHLLQSWTIVSVENLPSADVHVCKKSPYKIQANDWQRSRKLTLLAWHLLLWCCVRLVKKTDNTISWWNKWHKPQHHLSRGKHTWQGSTIFLLHLLVCSVCVHMHQYLYILWHIYGGQGTTSKTLFSLLTKWARLSGLVAHVSTEPSPQHWTKFLIQNFSWV